MTNNLSSDVHEDTEQAPIRLSSLANPRRVRWSSKQATATQDS